MKHLHQTAFGSRCLKVLLIATVFFLILIFMIALLFAAYVNKHIEKTIDETLFGMVGTDSETTLYYDKPSETDPTHVEMREENLYGGYRCIYADIEQMPQDLLNAFVSIEDKRFYSHHGVDWKRTASAGINCFLQFSDSYGGSTITQQLIKNVTDRDDYSFQRKLQEIFWALDLETKMDKREILGLYLNIINLSQGCYGVQAAANYYFSKDVSLLTLNECACIAAITNNPSYYDPLRNPEHNRQRKNLILEEMYEQGYITEEALSDARNTDVTFNIHESHADRSIHSWYVDMVIEDVVNDLVEEKGYSRTMANLMIYTGGLRIYTAMDAEIQQILDDYYADTSHFYQQSDGTHPQSSMIVIDPSNGDILGVAGAVGGKQANRLQNFATQTLRPAGSVIKPLAVYAPAMEQGLITWSSVYDDVPVKFSNDQRPAANSSAAEPVAWPKNANGAYRGLTNINYAIEHSVNTVVVRVLEELTVERSFSFLYDQLQIKSLIAEGYTADGSYITDMDLAALALGQMNYGVTVKEITAAYSIFAHQGIYNQPRSYRQVTDSNGSILLEQPYVGNAVLSEGNAAVMSLMLENVVTNGTAKSITLQNSVPCAGKTGTTQNNYDRWYIGYTPYVIGGVWYGYEYPQALSGTNQCVAIWDQVMQQIHKRKGYSADEGQVLTDTSQLIQAEYCADSGKLMTQACKSDPRGDRQESGYFVPGTEPTEYCTCHVPVAYDKESGGIAFADGCPNPNLQYIGLIHVERRFPVQVTVTDAQYVWRDIGTDVLPETSASLPFFHNLLADGEFCGISKAEKQYNRFCSTHFNYFAWQEKKREAS